MNKWLKITILPLMLLMLLPLLPLRVMAAGESVTAEIPFLVRNAPGTVVLEAVTEGAPLPNPSRIENVNKDAFKITFTEAGDYLYTVYQEKGTAPGISYDTDTVHEVGISVIYDSNGNLTYLMGISKKGSTAKVEGILFENTPTYAYLDIVKLAKSDGKVIDGVFSGSEFLYEISVVNLGGAPATDVTITDILPTELPLLILGTIYDGGVLSDDGKSITWRIPYIAPDERVTVSFTVSVPPIWNDTIWVNTAQAIYYGGFALGGGSAGSVTTATATASAAVSAPAPRVMIEKQQSLNGADLTKERISVKPGDKVTYHLTVTNNSDAIAEDVTVTDVIPNPPLLIVDEESISHDGTLADGVITWKLGDMEGGESITLSFTVTIPVVSNHTVWVNTGFGSYSNPADAELGQRLSSRIAVQSYGVEVEYVPANTPAPTPAPSGGDTTPGGTTPEGGTPGTPSGGNVPQTGDNSNLVLWIMLMIGSFAGLVIFVLIEKKRRNKEK